MLTLFRTLSLCCLALDLAAAPAYGVPPASKTMPPPQTIQLWPHGAPGPKTATAPEADTTTQEDNLVAGRPVIRLGNVSEATVTVYRPAQETETGTAVLVFPGGGYQILAMDLEGTEICHWLNSLGVTAVLVKYRVPQPLKTRYAEPLEDAERAMSVVRAHSADWHIRPDRIGVLGFSAGGHLAAVLSQQHARKTYPQVDQGDTGSVRPAFAILIYPAYLSVRDEGIELAPEAAVQPGAPPTFLVQAENDHKFVEGTLLYYRALERANVPAEMHLFAQGGHGYGLRQTELPVTRWPQLAAEWLRTEKFLPAQ